MPRTDREPSIAPSLLDRLLDDKPGVSEAPGSSRTQTVRQLEQSVARDLEALFNTRREALEEIPADLAETGRSLLTYGLPDFTSFSLLGPEDRTRIRRAVEQTIAAFEPRLDRVRVSLEPPREHDRTLRFRVDALLRVDPAPEAVTFDAVLQVITQQYVVQGQD
jgi:type VI secretion system protein ImpF